MGRPGLLLSLGKTGWLEQTEVYSAEEKCERCSKMNQRHMVAGVIEWGEQKSKN